MKLDKMGWIVAAGLAGAMFGMGMQPATAKFANVDMAKVFDEADLTRTSNTELQDFGKARLEVLQFLQQNLPMKPEDAKKYAKLAITSPRSSADDAEIKRIKADADTDTTRQRVLVTKQSPTPEDTKAMSDYSARAAQNNDFGHSLEQQFDTEIKQKQLSLHDAAMGKVRTAVKDVAQKQGYTIVFGVDAAPYAANDLTAEVLKVVKK